MPRGAVLEGFRAPGALDFGPIQRANEFNAEVFLRKQQMALHDASLKQQDKAANDKQRQENYKYGVKIIQNEELQKNVPAERQPKFLQEQQNLLNDLAREFEAGGNPGMGELDMKYGGKVNQLLQLKAGMTEAEKNIASVAGGLKTIPGVNPDKAEQFLRRNVFKPDGTMGDFTAEGLQKLLEDNAGEIVVDASAADKYRKGLGVSTLTHNMKTTDRNGASRTANYTSSLNPDMILDADGRPVIRGSAMRLNERPSMDPISVGGVKLNYDDQVAAQVELQGATGKTDLRFLGDDDFKDAMTDAGVRYLVNARVQAAKDHYRQTYGEDIRNPKSLELLRKSVAYDVMSDAADAKSVERIEQKAAPAPKITINNGKNDNAEAVDWFSGSNLSPEDQEKSLTARFNNLKTKSPKANGFTLTSLGDKNMAEYLRNVAKGSVTDEVGKTLNDNGIALAEDADGNMVLYRAKEGKFNFKDEDTFIGTVDQAGFNEFMNTKYGAYSPSKRKVTTPGIAKPGAGGQGQSGKVKVNIGGKMYEVPNSSLSQMDKDGVKYTIVK
jgi:hypothetical protein